MLRRWLQLKEGRRKWRIRWGNPCRSTADIFNPSLSSSIFDIDHTLLQLEKLDNRLQKNRWHMARLEQVKLIAVICFVYCGSVRFYRTFFTNAWLWYLVSFHRHYCTTIYADLKILKLLDNEDMDPSELDGIKDDVDYYIEVCYSIDKICIRKLFDFIDYSPDCQWLFFTCVLLVSSLLQKMKAPSGLMKNLTFTRISI